MILICRHGQTKWNLENRKQGWLDSELTELGKSQATPLRGALLSNVSHIFLAPDEGAVADVRA